MAAEVLKNLHYRRGSFKAKLSRFEKFIQTATLNLQNAEDSDISGLLLELETRFNITQTLLQEFENVQLEIEMLSTDIDDENAQREDFENNFYPLIAQTKKLIHTYSVNRIPSAAVSQKSNFESTSEQKNNVKLPTIQIPNFSGHYERWMEYHDTFDSLINSNTSIHNIEKFHYLRASLIGDAANVISSIELSADNYHIAWQLLCERYANKKLLTHNHVHSIFNLQPITKECSQQIRNLIDNISSHLRALKSLNQPTQEWDLLLNYIICGKLCMSLAREWESYEYKGELPTFHDLITFLKTKADICEKIEARELRSQNKQNIVQPKIKPHFGKTQLDSNRIQTTNKSFLSSNRDACTYCKAAHPIYNCPEFINLTINSRIEAVKKLKLCFNCLSHAHMAGECKRGTCKKCSSKHNTLLHINTAQNANFNENSKATSSSVALSNHTRDNTTQVLLSTVIVQIKDKHGIMQNCRAILDSASQSNYVTERFCNIIGATLQPVDISIQGIGQVSSHVRRQCYIGIQSCHNAFETSVSCLVIPIICNFLPNSKICVDSLDIPHNIRLADPTFAEPSNIDLLLGAGIFWQLLCVGQIRLGFNKPILQKTKLGWVISGPLGTHAISTNTKHSICNFTTNLSNQEQDQLSRFWVIEECPSDKIIHSSEEIECESHFQQTHTRSSDGHFVVSIPMKHSVDNLGESKALALKRFQGLERKLQNNDSLKNMYIQFMREYESLGHMSKMENQVLTCHSEPLVEYFMPHHGVLKDSSLTTKLRVVFNASAPTTSGWSFNDCQMIGPTIQSDLFSILIRFRQYRYVATSDIEKMYRMIWVNPEQRPLQQIVWRENPLDPISVYQLNTVTYGTSSSPFLAIRCLHQLALENVEHFPEAAFNIANNFYVDDLLTGNDDLDKLSVNCQQVSDILKGAGFYLRKWISNEPKFLINLFNHSDSNVMRLGPNENSKTLGILWSSRTDTLIFNTSSHSIVNSSTKRSILAGISQIFDPLGLLSACIIKVKILIQKLWLEKLTWDEAVSLDIHTAWLKFRDEIYHLQHFQIPRHVRCKDPVVVELHGFSDASLAAYGGCIYIRSIDHHGNIHVNLLCAKAKVAPLKCVTIPKLELCGALTLTRLSHQVIKSLNYKFQNVVYWTDSTIVLGWIQTSPHLLKTFVSNRVAEIQTKSSPKNWHYVPTNQNPADFLSRGINPRALISLEAWWSGPTWLSQPESNWPNSCNYQFESELPELKSNVKTLITVENEAIPFKRFSNFNRLVRSIAYCIRFKNNCLTTKSLRNYNSLTVLELHHSTMCIIKQVQAESFRSDLTDLNQNKQVCAKSKFLSLNPFLDKDGIIRVGGRITYSDFEYNKKHPILLSAKHQFTKLLFENMHKLLCHTGPQHLLSSIRENYWPIGGRNLSKQIYRSCIKCFKVNPSDKAAYLMGNLPQSRTAASFPFNVTGVDYFGPLYIKDRKGRGCKVTKAYVSLFICFASKAIHIELVTDMSSEAFIAALKRFISRRGKPSKIFSDNGTNFVGANNEIKETIKILNLKDSTFSNFCANQGIEWEFIPAYSPHFGGLWEAGVKSIKSHLKRVVGNVYLTYEELSTVLVQIEAILNSRPLTPLSTNPVDLEPITPSHFLIGRSLTSIPEHSLEQLKEGHLNRYQRVQQMRQHIWRRWSLEYISELQCRSKWKKNQHNIKLNTLVLIKDKNLPPLRWSLGRVVTLHHGSDGVVRVVSIRTSHGVIKRAVTNICPLPTDNEQIV